MARSNRKFKCLGYELRSKFELDVATDLINKGCSDWDYEREAYPWMEKISRAQCVECGAKKSYIQRSYTPDVFLPNGIIIEVKGIFTSKDRKIALAMKEQRPDLDIRMIFQRDNKLARNSSTRYSEFCDKHGIKWAIKRVPEEWLNEDTRDP